MSRNMCIFQNDKIYLHFCMNCPSLLRKTQMCIFDFALGIFKKFCAKNFLFWFLQKNWGYTIFKYPSYKQHKHLQHHQDQRHHQHPYHQHEKHRPTSLYLFQTVPVSDENSSFWERSWEYLFLQNFCELKSPMKNRSPLKTKTVLGSVNRVEQDSNM